MREIYDPECKYFKERNGRKKVWVDRELLERIDRISEENKIEPQKVVDYFISLGVNTVENYPEKRVIFDVKKL
jgi:hypothetical protein|tara:strand:+ start:407 stop:625 length:219 start_codon:yes stop_codon:yes gene_type:complete